MTETPEAIESILEAFRSWLQAHTADSGLPESSPEASDSVDLFTLLAQFTALRHEVNMQTRTMRSATEQVGELLKRNSEPETPPDPGAALLPLAKVFLDIADALMLSLRQVEKARDTALTLLPDSDTEPEDREDSEDCEDLEDAEATPAPPAQPGFFRRLFGSSPAPAPAAPAPREQTVREQAGHEQTPQQSDRDDKLQNLLASMADGYNLSIRRVERALPLFDLETIETVGEMFDPEWMEAVEVVDGDGLPTGTVIEELRRGYRRHGRPYRFALVKVAR